MRRPGTRPPLTAKRERSAATKEVTASSRDWVPAFADDICRVRDSKLADLDAAQSRQVALYRDGICKPRLGAWGDAPDPRGSHTPQVITEKSRGLAVSRVAKVAADLAYREQSPITCAARIKTPTLILSTTGDARVPVTRSYRLYHALKDNGVTMRFVAWPVPGHFPSDPVRTRSVYLEWIGWLDAHLNPQPEGTPASPLRGTPLAITSRVYRDEAAGVTAIAATSAAVWKKTVDRACFTFAPRRFCGCGETQCIKERWIDILRGERS